MNRAPTHSGSRTRMVRCEPSTNRIQPFTVDPPTWITSMTSDEKNRCRVCGLLLESPPWGDDGRTPLFEYCPCCGGEWDQPDRRPSDWDREKQMAHIPAGYR